MEWAEEQTSCPAGHEMMRLRGIEVSAVKFSYDMCPTCPLCTDGRGHFFLWCDLCRQFYSPPGCRKPKS